METEHAKQNAAATYANIAEMVAAAECDYDRLEELQDERADLAAEADDDENDDREAAQKALQEWDAENGEELAALLAAATIDGEVRKDADEARERIQEDPLSVEIRSGWYTPGETPEPEEFCILLTTGGPACRIRGELDENREPCRAWLEYQDWGTPWTQYHDAEQETLLSYCRHFYFGD